MTALSPSRRCTQARLLAQPVSRPARLAALVLLACGLAGTLRAQATLPDASLDAYVGNLLVGLPRAATEAFVEPSPAELADFASCIEDMARDDVPAALACLDGVGYDLFFLVDATAGRQYLVAQERAVGFRGLGTYVIDPTFARNLVLAAPHPLFDTNTATEGRRLFQELRARGLFIAGTHRCANAALSPCSGTSAACGSPAGPYPVSDVAHYEGNFLQAAHAALLQLDPVPLALSLHGNAAEPVDVELSDGTTDVESVLAPIHRLRAELVARAVSVGSCNWPPDAGLGLALCGTTNVQGRLLNGSASPCTVRPPVTTGHFIHVEQRRSVRDDPTTLSAAMDAAFQVDGIRLFVTRTSSDVVLAWTGSAAPWSIRRDVDPRFATAPATFPSAGPPWSEAIPPGAVVYYDAR